MFSGFEDSYQTSSNLYGRSLSIYKPNLCNASQQVLALWEGLILSAQLALYDQKIEKTKLNDAVNIPVMSDRC